MTEESPTSWKIIYKETDPLGSKKLNILNDEGLIGKYQCGGSNKYKTIKTGVASHAEMTTTVRTNMQEIANDNGQLDQYGYMFGKFLKKNADSYFLSGLFKALSEGDK